MIQVFFRRNKGEGEQRVYSIVPALADRGGKNKNFWFDKADMFIV